MIAYPALETYEEEVFYDGSGREKEEHKMESPIKVIEEEDSTESEKHVYSPFRNESIEGDENQDSFHKVS